MSDDQWNGGDGLSGGKPDEQQEPKPKPKPQPPIPPPPPI